MSYFRLSFFSGLTFAFLSAPVLSMVDHNNDRVSDVWAAMYPTAGAADADPDGDGANNRAEAIANTDALSASSRFTATQARDSNGNLMLRWNARSHKIYRIESSNDLKTWTSVLGSVLSD